MAVPRIPLKPEKMYHIWNHGNGDENLFRSEKNYIYFLEKYSYYIVPVARTFAYRLMPNHFHFMIRVREADELRLVSGFETLKEKCMCKAISRRFSNLFNGYTQAYNKMYDRKGRLFMDSFNRKEIRSPIYFSRLLVYIHNNPIYHGFVTDVNDWQYSSWHAYMGNKKTKVNRDEGWQWFGNKDDFLKMHEDLKEENVVLQFED